MLSAQDVLTSTVPAIESGGSAAPAAATTGSNGASASNTNITAAPSATTTASIVVSTNIYSPGFATPLPATVGIFASQQGPADPTAAPGSIIPPQPSQFVAPPSAPLTGGDVSLASPKGNAAPPNQNPSDSMLDDGLIAHSDSAEDVQIRAAADQVFQTFADRRAADDVGGQAYAKVVDKLAADEGLPVIDHLPEINLLSHPSAHEFENGFQAPFDKSPPPDAAPNASLDQAQLDRKTSLSEGTQAGAVAVWAGAGLWWDRHSAKEGGHRRGRRFGVAQRIGW